MEIQNVHKTNLQDIPESNITRLFDRLALSQLERDIILQASGRPETTIALARRVSKPRSTVQGAIERLHGRHLLYQTDSMFYKNPRWKSDLHKTLKGLNRFLWNWEVDDKIYRD